MLSHSVGLALQPGLSSVLRACDVAVAQANSAEVGDLRLSAGTAVGGVGSTGLVEVASLAIDVEGGSRVLAGNVVGYTVLSRRNVDKFVVGVLDVEVGDSSGRRGGGRSNRR